MENYVGKLIDGFYVTPMMQRIRAAQLDVLKEIDKVCRNHSINWFADFGTLLGAVRHKGYIPWDDDLDIGMRRLDFERFKKYAKVELPSEYYCNLDRDANIKKLVFCVYNRNGINTDNDWLKKNHGCPYPVGVDIFVYDNIPDNAEEREDYLAVYSYTSVPTQRLNDNQLYDECDEELKGIIDGSEKLTGVQYDRKKPLKVPMLILADQIAAMYYDDITGYVAIAGYLTQSNRYLFKTGWVSELIILPFEGIHVNCPVGYDEILKRWYGDDYMTPKKYEEHDDYYAEQKIQLISMYENRGMQVPKMFLD